MLTLRKAGIYTTVQDNGRFFGANLGIPCSGAMDRQSAEMANLILGNDKNDALLECTFTGPIVDFHAPTLIAIMGAEVPAFLNQNPINSSTPIQIKDRDTLSFGKIEKGCRFYIGIKGGIQSEAVFNSRSVCFTSNILNILRNGDKLSYKSHSGVLSSSVSMKRSLGNNKISVSRGPEYSILEDTFQKGIFTNNFSILPESNRMAFRVKHALDLTHSYSILSSGTLPGTVQLTPSGEIIILMRDTQTTGGYPRILQLSEDSISDLAQLIPGQEFSFQLV